MKLFSTGLEQANLVITSNLPQFLWEKISELYNDEQSLPGLRHRIWREPKYTVIAFVTSPEFAKQQLEEGVDLVSSSSPIVGESFALFEFLRGKKADFAINRAAITLFHDQQRQLSELKDKIDYSKPIIVTGHALGGSIASLFTLWLLESVNFSNTKRPICITFGSPLIGDGSLQKALFQYSPWNSCFLHVVSNQDPVPRKYINQNVNGYKPFGTFLLCSDSGCSCFEEPETILKLLEATAYQGAASQGPNGGVDYGKVVEDLKRKALFKNISKADTASSPYAAGIVTQLRAIEYEHKPEEDINTLVKDIEKQEKKFLIQKRTVKPDKKLNEAKIKLAKLEWYKKTSKDRGVGYYDSYKNKTFMSDINVEEIVKRLLNYWSDVVEEADKQPQKEGASLRTRWLYSGMTYKRMVEPLYIAEYYHDKCLSDYENRGRLKHFVRLEQLFNEAKETTSSSIEERRKNVSHIMTDDSCFWAKVEEAINSCKLLKEKEASLKEKRTCMEKLTKFENHVLDLLDNYAVSPEIFLRDSSFMQWWEDYKDVAGKSTRFTDFMRTRKYREYS